jgi:hypothetical protein
MVAAILDLSALGIDLEEVRRAQAIAEALGD